MKEDFEAETRLRRKLEGDLKAALERSEKEKQRVAVLQVEVEDARAVLKYVMLCVSPRVLIAFLLQGSHRTL